MLLLQFAHVTRPVVGLEDGDGVVADAARRETGGGRDLLHEELDQRRDVVAPLGEARHAQRHDVEAVIEVVAEAVFLHLAFEVAAGRGHDPHVDGDLGPAAEALELLLDENPEHLALGLDRHVGDLVDVERAAVRFLERADLARARAVLGAEHLLLDAIGRHRGGVEHDEGAVGADRLGVDHACGEFLAGARGAADEDAAVGRRDALDLVAKLVDRGGLADHLGALHRALAQRLHFAAQLRGFERAQRHEHQPVGFERLLDVVVGAAPDRGHRGFDVAVARDDDDRQIGVLLLDCGQHLEAVETAPLQARCPG